jgi:hypothetical protein
MQFFYLFYMGEKMKNSRLFIKLLYLIFRITTSRWCGIKSKFKKICKNEYETDNTTNNIVLLISYLLFILNDAMQK